MRRKEKKASAQNEAVVSLTFDDAYESVYLNAYPSMKERGFRGVIFVIAGLIADYFEGHKIMNEKQLHEVYSNGWEIGSHSFSHPYSLTFSKYTPKQYATEITLSKSKLEKLGFDVISFSYPHGSCSAAPMIEEIKRSYKYARTSNQGTNEICRSNLFLKTVQFANDRFNVVKRWIDKLKSEGGWLILTCHGIVSDVEPLPEPVYGWSHKTALDRLLNYIEEKEIRVATFRDLCKSMPDY
jgi:peptidoglycan/xylan/chitin deacetylase (PgdA/CDA1 family)